MKQLKFNKDKKIKPTRLLLIISLLINISMGYEIYTQYSIDKKVNIGRNFINTPYKLGDYTYSKYKISEEGKKIIIDARQTHQTPSLISAKYRDKEICSGYIWTVTEKIWGKDSPYYIGMMDRETKRPSTAWELEDSYDYMGGTTLIDFSKKLNLKTFREDYRQKISTTDILNFINYSFREENLLGDIGFLYKNTKHIKGLLEEGVYNSHITKNIGVSKFEKQITTTDSLDNHLLIIDKLFDIKKENNKHIYSIIRNYMFYLDDREIILDNGNFYFYDKETGTIGEKVNFKYLDKISYYDTTLIHFFENKSHTNSLLDILANGEFFPINIIGINPTLIEKI